MLRKWSEGVKFPERVGVIINQAEIVRAEVCTKCLLCGESIPMCDFRENPIKICDDCKRLWKELKETRSDSNDIK